MRILASALVAASLLLAPQQIAAQSIFKDVGSLLNGLGVGSSSSLSNGEVAGGLKDALRVGTEAVTGILARRMGF
ncbi:MAG: hypothetical protein ACKVH0_21425 [Alphaproteobacteria bacterium]